MTRKSVLTLVLGCLTALAFPTQASLITWIENPDGGLDCQIEWPPGPVVDDPFFDLAADYTANLLTNITHAEARFGIDDLFTELGDQAATLTSPVNPVDAADLTPSLNLGDIDDPTLPTEPTGDIPETGNPSDGGKVSEIVGARLVVLGLSLDNHEVASDQISTTGCRPRGTGRNDVIRCSGVDTRGVDGRRGDDSITVEADALVSTIAAAPELRSTAIDGGKGDDTITNLGEIRVSVLFPDDGRGDIRRSARDDDDDDEGDNWRSYRDDDDDDDSRDDPARAVGIDGGIGADTITNRGSIDVFTVVDAVSDPSAPAGNRNRNSRPTVTADESVGIDGGSGNDVIVNRGDIRVITATTAELATEPATHTRNLGFRKTGDDDFESNAGVAGISGGSGDDHVVNSGTLGVQASAGTVPLRIGVDAVIDAFSVEQRTNFTTAAIGIDTGTGNDIVDNQGTIESFANAASRTGTSGSVIINAIQGNLSQEVSAAATGIDSGDGIDRVENSGEIESVANAVILELGTPVNLVGASGAAMDSSASADAVAIDLGTGSDQLTNTGALSSIANSAAVAVNVAVTGAGASLTLGGPRAESSATGIKADDNIASSVNIEFTEDRIKQKHKSLVVNQDSGITWSKKELRADVQGIEFSSLPDLSATIGNDSVDNSGEIIALATAAAPELDVPIAATGVSAAMTAASASAAARAIDLGGGDDQITNSGTLTAASTATALAANIALTGTGASLALGGPEAEAIAVGIESDGGGTIESRNTNLRLIDGRISEETENFLISANRQITRTEIEVETGFNGIELESSRTVSGVYGDDVVTNDGNINAIATAVTPELDIAATLALVAVSVTGSSAESGAIAIDLGGGDDLLANSGSLTSVATSTALAVNASVTGIGLSLSLGGPEAAATATGIEADGGGSDLEQKTAIGFTAGHTLRETMTSTFTRGTRWSRSTTIEEFLFQQAELTREKTVTSASGNDIVDNDGVITAVATAISPEADAAAAVVGAVVAVTASRSDARSTAIALGGASDDLDNTGELISVATATALAASIPVTGVGASLALGGAEAEATAVGIEGDDEQANLSQSLSVNVETRVAVGTGEVSEGAFDGSASVEWVRSSRSTSGNDTIGNQAAVTAVATATTPEMDIAVTLVGTAVADTAAVADASAVAIDLGGGDDSLDNTGSLVSVSTATAFAANIPIVGFGPASSLGGPEATATATGIMADSGAANRERRLTVNLDASAAGSVGDRVSGTFDGSLFAEWLDVSESASGNDRVVNVGDVTSVATATTPELDVAIGIAGAASAITASIADASAVAIDLGGDDDSLTNTGTLTSVATATAVAANIPVAGSGAATALGGPTAEATAVGIEGDSGEANHSDRLTINVEASAEGGVGEGAAGSFAGSIFVETLDQTTSTTGNDTIINSGAVKSVATATAPELDIAVALAGVATADTVAKATSRASAIDLGGADDRLTNTGELISVATSTAVAANISVAAGTGVATANGGPEADATAVGIDGDSGEANHSERLTVDLEASASAGVSDSIAGSLAGSVFVEWFEQTTGVSGDDTIFNSGNITSVATATSPELDVAVGFSGVNTAVTASIAIARAKAIDLGGGDDRLNSSGVLTSVATATAVAVNVTVAGGTGAASALGGPTANATAIGIDGDSGEANHSKRLTVDLAASASGRVGDSIAASFDGSIFVESLNEVTGTSGNDNIENDATIVAVASATAPEQDVAAGISGAATAVTAATATARAKAIDLGGGDDDLKNTGVLTSVATATAVAANIPVTGGGGATAIGGPTADATAVGIDGDSGVENRSERMTINLEASASGGVKNSIAASFDGKLSVERLSETSSASGNDVIDNDAAIVSVAAAITPEADVAIGIAGSAIAETASNARVRARAIDLGGRDDRLENNGILTSVATATAIVANISVTGATGLVVARGGAESEAVAVGIEGDSGEDEVSEQKTVNLEARIEGAVGEVAAGSFDGSLLVNESRVANGVSGNDIVNNNAAITAVATALTPELSVPVAVTGVAVANTNSQATANARAIDLGGGNDELNNSAALTSVATATAAAANISVAGVGAVKSLKTWAAAVASAGAGVPLAIVETLQKGAGVAIVLGGPQADALALGINGDNGENDSTTSLTITAEAETLGTLGEDGAGGSFDGSMLIESIAASESTSGNDLIINDGVVTSVATALTAEADIAAGVFGAGIAFTASSADAEAGAINAGGGDDAVVNFGVLTSVATSTALAASVPIAGVGAALGFGGPEADALATGIAGDSGDASQFDRITVVIDANAAGGVADDADGSFVGTSHFERFHETRSNSGDDLIESKAAITAVATAITAELDTPIGYVGVAAAVTAARATAEAAAIDAGGGSDRVDSNGALTAVATATGIASNRSVTGSGLSIGLGGPEAEATAVGIAGDSGAGNRKSRFTAEIQAEAAGGIGSENSGTFDGSVRVEMHTENDTGSGDDIVHTDSAISTIATAATLEADVSIAMSGIAVGVTASAARAESGAIELGGGADVIDNQGTLTSVATAAAPAANIALQSISGISVALGGAEAEAIASGIDAGSDGNWSSQTTTLEASLQGAEFQREFIHRSDDGDDRITNDGNVTAVSTAVAPSLSVTASLIGIAVSVTTATASSEAAAIESGAGNDNLTNRGVLDIVAVANADAVNVSLTPAGVAVAANNLWNGGTTAEARATGIDTDGDTTEEINRLVLIADADGAGFEQYRSIGTASGDDSVVNDGAITATAVTVAPAVSATVAVIGIATSVSDSNARAEAAAIDTGGGNDSIDNRANLEANSLANADAVNVSITGLGFAAAANSVWNGGTTAEASSTGISADGNGELETIEREMTAAAGISILNRTTREYAAGNDSVTNSARIDVDATAVAVSVAGTVSVGGIAAAVSTSTATSRGVAIDAGNGDDTVINTGDLSADASSTAVTVNATLNVIGAAAALDALWSGGTTTEATAIGIAGDAEASRVVDELSIAATASGLEIDSETIVETADGDDDITNEGSISVSAGATSPSVSVAVSGTLAAAGATSSAQANATAIDAGGGMNQITNSGALNSFATSSAVAVGASAALLAGVTVNNVWDGGTRSQATASGIRSGSSRDRVENSANLISSANSSATSVGVSVSLAGVAGSISTSSAVADARAIETGGGDDELMNTGRLDAIADASARSTNVTVNGIGAALASDSFYDGGTTADATVKAIDGEAGEDAITNEAAITVNANSKTKSASVAAQIGGVVGAVSASTSTAKTTAIDGGADADSLTNQGGITTISVAEASGLSVAVTLAGAAGAGEAVWDGTTTADAESRGIVGGDGNDGINNAASIISASLADAESTGVSVTMAGAASAEADAIASSLSTAIVGGTGDDAIDNSGTLTVLADADARGTAVSTGLFGIAAASVSSTATAVATGIDGGEGHDVIENTGTLDVDADSDAAGASADVTLAGAAVNPGYYAGARADVTAVGIAGGDGMDSITNAALVDVDAVAGTSTSNVSIALVGFADERLEAPDTAIARASGIDGGSDDDLLDNQGMLQVHAQIESTARSFTLNIAGAALADFTATTDTIAIGIDGGAGNDTITSSGKIVSKATSTSTVSGKTVSLVGFAEQEAKSASTASATGINGGEGSDQITQSGVLESVAKSTVTVSGSSWNLAGGATANSDITSLTTAVGIHGNQGDDNIVNSGTSTAKAVVNLSSSGSKWTLAGTAGGNAGMTSRAEVVGIHGGDGRNSILNSGTLTATTSNTSSISTSSWTLAGKPTDSGNLVATSRAIGIASGADGSKIQNDGNATVTGNSTLTVGGGSTAIFGKAGSELSVTAASEAIGIEIGGGESLIDNGGTLSVTSSATMSSTRASFSFVGSPSSVSLLTATSFATGIVGGNDINRLHNRGEIIVIAKANQTASGGSKTAVAGGSESSANSRAIASAIGFTGGDGDDAVINDNAIRVKANPRTSTTTSTATNSAEAGFIFGSAGSISGISLSSASYGAVLRNGDDNLTNNGLIDVIAGGDTMATANADGARLINGDAVAGATSTTGGTAYGIRGDNGENFIYNTGTVNVLSNPKARATASANGNGADGDGNSRASASVFGTAIGIEVGADSNVIGNSGNLTVESAPEVSALALADSDLGGAAVATATSSANATAIGVRALAGAGSNEITNDGTIDVRALPLATASAGASADSVEICGPFGFICGTIQFGTTSASRNATKAAAGYGVRTEGHGNQFIENNGVILVNAPASRTAVGIQTGSGDDIVINNGRIETTVGTSEGIAILTGAGGDSVTLGDGSFTKGDIDLGPNDDTLHLVGTPILNSSISSGTGTDSLIFDGAGSFSKALPGFAIATKQGAGTYTLPTLATMQSLDMIEGTLQINNNYSMASDGTFSAQVNGDGTHGQLQSTGNVALGGDLKVVKGPGAYVDGTRYDIVSANSVNGSFASETLPAPTAVLSFDVNQLPTAVQVEATVEPFTTQAASGNEVQTSVAIQLDTLTPTAKGGLSNMLGSLQDLSAAELSTAFAGLSPDSYNDATTASLSAARRYLYGARNRMADARGALRLQNSETGGFALKGDAPLFQASAGSVAEMSNGFGLDDSGPWVAGFGSDGTQSLRTGGYQGFSYDSSGLMIGFDFSVTRQLEAGVSFGTTFTGFELDRARGNGEVESAIRSAYATYLFDNGYFVDTAISFGENTYDNLREIRIGNTLHTAISRHKGELLSAFLESGKGLEFGRWRAEVYGALEYMSLKEDGFEEFGAGSANLIIEGRRSESIFTELGFRSGRNFVLSGGGTITPQFSASWLHELRLDDGMITAQLAEAPDAAFRLNIEQPGRNGIRLRGMLDYTGRKQFSLSARLEAELREDRKDMSALVQAEWRF